MVKGNTKRVVVIKDIPSNIIEEAILILKPDPVGKDGKSPCDLPAKSLKRDNDYLTKEAELIIGNYINESKTPQGKVSQPEEKKVFPVRKFITNVIINAVLVGSITLLVLILAKVI